MITIDDLMVAVLVANATRIPFDPDVIRVARGIVAPALADLPEHLRCELVEDALMTVFLVGVATGEAASR